MTTDHIEEGGDYNSSSDEDYDPSKETCDPQDEIDDNSRDDEEIAEEADNFNKPETEKVPDASGNNDTVDVDAIFAELTGIKPPTDSCVKPESSSNATTNDTSKVEDKCYRRPDKNVSSETTDPQKVYPKRSQSSSNESVKHTGTKRMGVLDATRALTKRSKMSVLDRSDQDWKDFTAQHNLKEDLESHNRGKGGYLNKMEFLSRADNRQFEKEKAFRATARKDNGV
uniref:Craniofacial development protein 1 n=1 Tax=Caenorhabditis tropicalis TaxID=1561998 RepID=A0A1I7UY60_9PELO